MFIKKILKREKGQGLVEYALILVLIAIVVIAILALLGPSIGGVYSNVVCALENDGSISGVEVTQLGSSVRVEATVSSSVDSVSVSGSISGSISCDSQTGTCRRSFGGYSGDGGSIRVTTGTGGCAIASW